MCLPSLPNFLIQYVGLASYVMLVYDHIITFEDEVCPSMPFYVLVTN